MKMSKKIIMQKMAENLTIEKVDLVILLLLFLLLKEEVKMIALKKIKKNLKKIRILMI